MRSQQALQDYLQSRRRMIVLFCGGIVLVGVMLFGYVWQYVKLVEIQMRITQTQKELTALLEQIDLIEAERARLARLDRVEEVATQRLGMALPAKHQLWYIPVSAGGQDRGR